MDAYAQRGDYSMIIHAAAFTSPPKIDQDPLKAVEVNIIGTANVVRLCIKHNLKLVYISTDYVFRGDKGNYRENDEVFPVNRYAWSKLGGECAVRMYDSALKVKKDIPSGRNNETDEVLTKMPEIDIFNKSIIKPKYL